MYRVDLNCDLGESFGAYKLGLDEEILPFVTSANVACGFHAGDPAVMRKTVALALNNNVAKQQDALITNDEEAVTQVVRMVKEGRVISRQGTDVAVKADTVCIHGDGTHALAFAKKIRESLLGSGITVKAIGD